MAMDMALMRPRRPFTGASLRRMGVAALVVMLLASGGRVVADTVRLTNGNIVEGRIVDESPTAVRINTGTSTLSLPRTSIASIERGVSAVFLRKIVEKGRKTAAGHAEAGKLEEAYRAIESAQAEFSAAVRNADKLPAETEALRAELERERVLYVAGDPNQKKAEELYQAALKALDRVQLEEALRLLSESATTAPNRLDVQALLGETAIRLNEPVTAIRAYRELIQTEPETYYAKVGAPLLKLLEARGTKLLADRQADEAVDVFKEVLLLRGAKPGEPAAVQDFLARKAERSRKTEEQVLMEVYAYADSNDLVDLAFASVKRIERVNPDNPEVKRLVARSAYLSDLQRALGEGDRDAAARLMSDVPEELRAEPGFLDKLKRVGGAVGREADARKAMEELRKVWTSGEFEKALEMGRRVASEFSNLPEGPEALEIVRDCEREIPIKAKLDAARKSYDAEDDATCETLLREAMQAREFDKSRFKGDVSTLLDRLPRERTADGLWAKARRDLDQEELEAARATLEELERDHPDTRSGAKAVAWLRDHRRQLQMKASEKSLLDENLFAGLTDANLWRAASSETALAGRRVAKIDEKNRGPAHDSFDKIVTAELEAVADRRPGFLHIGLPTLVGIALFLGLLFRFNPMGRGRYVSAPPPDAPTGEFREPTECRMCGLHLERGALVCGACGAATTLSEVELERLTDAQRLADFNPWDTRVRKKEFSNFAKFFDRAMELALTSDVQAAIVATKEALKEDPHRTEAWAMLAELYERIRDREKAADCYREILLLDPGNVVIRQKIEAVLNLAATPLSLGFLPHVLSLAFWWMVYFVAIGIDPGAYLLRLGLCVVGLGITVWGWQRVQATNTVPLVATKRGGADHYYPLPKEELTWGDLNKQARQIARKISDHTGIEVPPLTMWRAFWAATLSVVLLAALAALAYVAHQPVTLLAWPAGALLLVYYFELHPRILAAHVLLRHVMEEVNSMWADPHMHFVPKGMEGRIEGEFLVSRAGEFPLAWALRPVPYGHTRQAVLNALQHVLNRHFACHRFYSELRIMRDADVPMPFGFTRLVTAAILAAVLSLAGAVWHQATTRADERGYVESMDIGFMRFLDGEVLAARDEFLDAARRRAGFSSPYLYLAHTDAAAGFEASAEQAFEEALRRGKGVPAIHNDYGNFLHKQGRLRDALKQYQNALEKDPDNPDVLNNVGSAYFKLKEYDQAVGALRRVVALNPAHSRANTTLGLALEELGKLDEARASYEAAIKAAPDVAYTQVARDRLEAGLAGAGARKLTLDGAGR